MDPDAEGLPSYATHYWKKRIADSDTKCWGSGAEIKKGDECYVYIMELTLYGNNIEVPQPIVTPKEYFKHVLQGRPGFNYNIERRERDEK